MASPESREKRLLRELRVHGPRSGPELCRLLGISQPTFSRLIRRLPEILSIGAARSTRYAARREISGIEGPLRVYELGLAPARRPLAVLHPIQPRGFHVESEAPIAGFTDDLPWFLNDLRPGGFLGRRIPPDVPHLDLPHDVRLWSGDQVLRWLIDCGVEVVGNLVVGEEAARRVWEDPLPQPVEGTAREYTRFAERAMAQGFPGSSAGGEQPKFLALRGGHHVLVKFSPPLSDRVGRRVGDLLRAEHLALRQLTASGLSAARTRLVEGEGRAFLEVERIDRVGERGRRGLISMLSLDAEFAGVGRSWTECAEALVGLGELSSSVLPDVRWLDRFGALIGNTDRHGANLSFRFEGGRVGDLAPAYDMLPMHFYPRGGGVVDGPYAIPEVAEEWDGPLGAAQRFWESVAMWPGMSSEFVEIARESRARLAGLADPPPRP